MNISLTTIIEKIESEFLTKTGRLTRKVKSSEWIANSEMSQIIFEVNKLFESCDRRVTLETKIKCLLSNRSNECNCGKPLTVYSDFRRFVCIDCRNKQKNQKRIETTLQKYGVDHVSKTSEVKEKYTKTCLDKYGVEHSFKHKEVQKKRLKTLEDNYGVDNPFKSKVVKERIKEVNINKFGVENPSQSPEINEKKRHTYVVNYGVEHPRKNKDFVERQSKTRMVNYWNSLTDDQRNSYLNLEEIYQKEHVENEHTISYICQKYGLSYNYTKSKLNELNLPIIRRFYTSNGEIVLQKFIESFYSGNIIKNDRRVLDGGYEIDIYLPEVKLGIEYHGSFWHSNVDENKHLAKYKSALKSGISLMQIFDWELEEKESIVYSMIKSKIGIFDRVLNGENCKVKEISPSDYKSFCEDNHIQGYAPAKIKLGLFHDDELVSIMSFSTPRSKSNHTYEMIRYANKINTKIRGSASKLFKYFTRNFDFKSLVTFSDNRLFDGKIYETIGFSYVETSSPNYWYTTGDNKISAQKHKLRNLLGEENFDMKSSEKENMLSNGYRIVYDAGNKKFEFYK